MFDFQLELLDRPVIVNGINVKAVYDDPFSEPVEISIAESYEISDKLTLKRKGRIITELDNHFRLRLRLEVQSFLSASNTQQDLLKRVKRLTSPKKWFLPEDFALEVRETPNANYLPVEYFFAEEEDPLISDVKVISHDEALASFKSREDEIKNFIATELTKYLKQVMAKEVTDDFVAELNDQIISGGKNQTKKEVSPYSIPSDSQIFLDLDLKSNLHKEEYIADLFSFLKPKGLLEGISNKHDFNRLFKPGNSDQRLNWSGTVATLALFVKTLPLRNETPLQVAALLFTCKGRDVTNSQLNNNGRQAKTLKEKELVNFIEQLSATYG